MQDLSLQVLSLGVPHLENLSLNKTVTVSQRYNSKDFDPSLAVDGNHSTDLLKCSLTASGQKEAWLTVDLGEEKNIAVISFIHGGCKY
uniref:F5/8 type C domain-containing protein n=1 Tax=Magallana gigas TaxID=29159 RepID=K1PV18_MAGGI